MRERTRKSRINVAPETDPEIRPNAEGQWPPLDWAVVFNRRAPLALEIGTGNGIFLADEAAAHPETNFVGVERSREFFLKCKRRILEAGLTNVRLMKVDVMDILPMFPDKGLSRIYCLFSDPWPKRRHAGRRVFNPEFFPVLERMLVPGGELVFKTDVGWYFNLTVNQLRRRVGWVFSDRGPFERPVHPDDRAVTNFERKAREAGARCWGFRAVWTGPSG